MLDYLKSFEKENYDAIMFLPHEDEDMIHVEGKLFANNDTKLDGSVMGDCYHIILFKMDEEMNPINLDKFEAILSGPLEYISRLIPDGWFGMVCKKTEKSGAFVDATFAKLQDI